MGAEEAELIKRMGIALIEVSYQYQAVLLPDDKKRFLELARSPIDGFSNETRVMQMAMALAEVIEVYGSHMPFWHLNRIDRLIERYWEITGNRITHRFNDYHED